MKEKSTQPLAYSYIRMSTDMQLKGHSLERQKEKSKEYAHSKGLLLVENFEDIGVSAFKGKHIRDGMLGTFISLIESEKIPVGSYLLIESLDRLSRDNIFESIPLFIKILKSGIKIVTLMDERVYGAENADFNDLLYPMVVLSRAHEESIVKSYRVSKAWANKRKHIADRKLTQICPAWLRLNVSKNVFEPIAGRDHIVKRLFDLADSGYGSYSIGRILNDEQLSPFNTNSKGWHASYITRILNNRAVLGEFQPHKMVDGISEAVGDVVSDYFPKIINEDQFLRVKHSRRKRLVDGAGRKGHAYRNLFSGFAKCAYCDSPMRFVDKGPPPKGGRFLRCTKADRHFECSASSWNYEKFETAFLYYVQEIDLVETLKRAEEQSEQYMLEKSLVSLNEKILNKTELRDATFDLLQKSTASMDFIGIKLEKISMEIKHLEDQLTEVRSKIEMKSISTTVDNQQLKSLIAELKDSQDIDLERKRRTVASRLQMMIKSLTLAPDGLREEAGGKTIPPFGQHERLFDFFKSDLNANKVNMTFSIVFLDGVMRRVTVDRDDPLTMVRYLAVNDRGLIIDMDDSAFI